MDRQFIIGLFALVSGGGSGWNRHRPGCSLQSVLSYKHRNRKLATYLQELVEGNPVVQLAQAEQALIPEEAEEEPNVLQYLAVETNHHVVGVSYLEMEEQGEAGQ
jgi:hypothetical protein